MTSPAWVSQWGVLFPFPLFSPPVSTAFCGNFSSPASFLEMAHRCRNMTFEYKPSDPLSFSAFLAFYAFQSFAYLLLSFQPDRRRECLERMLFFSDFSHFGLLLLRPSHMSFFDSPSSHTSMTMKSAPGNQARPEAGLPCLPLLFSFPPVFVIRLPSFHGMISTPPVCVPVHRHYPPSFCPPASV